MGTRKVYIIHYRDDRRLTVISDGEEVPMDRFIQTHTPLQVSSLTDMNPRVDARNFIGLMIAEETLEEPSPVKTLADKKGKPGRRSS